MAPKIIIDLSGGLVQSITSEIPIEVEVIDFYDLDPGQGRVVKIDGENDAYVYAGISVEVDPDRAKDLHRQINEQWRDMQPEGS